MSSRRRTTALLATALVVTALVVAPWEGDRAAAAPGHADLSLAQRPLVEAAEEVRLTVDRGAYPGFAGIVLGDRGVTVWWKGTVPAPVAAVVRRVSRDVPVVVAAAAHSETEIAAAAREVRAWLDANPGTGIHGVKSPGDGSGLVLATYPGARADLPALRAAAGVPLTVRAEEPMSPGRTTRPRGGAGRGPGTRRRARSARPVSACGTARTGGTSSPRSTAARSAAGSPTAGVSSSA